jgi:hypothetical protein
MGRLRALILLVALTSMATFWLAGPPPPPAPAAPHDRAFWRSIVEHDYAVPGGASPADLVRELAALVGSPDRELRDAFGYEITARWICTKELIQPDDLRSLVRELQSNLAVKIGETGTDSTLLRSFSALNLSTIVRCDLDKPFLTQDEFQTLLDDAISYLAAEKDLRGFDPKVGWVHAIGHTADLLKVLVRSPKLPPGGAKRVLDAIAAKLAVCNGWFYDYGEDESLARAVVSILARKDFDPKGFAAWLGSVAAISKGLWDRPGTIDVPQFAAARNVRNMLQSLHTILSGYDDLTQDQKAARAAVLDTLSRM